MSFHLCVDANRRWKWSKVFYEHCLGQSVEPWEQRWAWAEARAYGSSCSGFRWRAGCRLVILLFPSVQDFWSPLVTASSFLFSFPLPNSKKAEVQPNTCCFHHYPKITLFSPLEDPPLSSVQWYVCTHTYTIYFQLHKDQICIEIIYVTSSKLQFKQARWKCPADLLPIRKTYLQLVVNGLLSFPFFPFLIISLLSLHKNFSATLKRLQVLFIFIYFSPVLLLPSKPQGFFLGFFWVFSFIIIISLFQLLLSYFKVTDL